jgi:uncharacterized protein
MTPARATYPAASQQQGVIQRRDLIHQSMSHVIIKSLFLDDPRPWMTPPSPRQRQVGRHYLSTRSRPTTISYQANNIRQNKMTHIVDFTRADFQDDYYTSSWSHGAASSQTTIDARWNLLSEFVAETCKGRDDSHGHAHMKAVAETARFIIQQDFIDESGWLTLDTITAAWLHDVADHKYDHDGTLQQRIDAFGTANIANYEEIKDVIKYVSFSTENKAIIAGTPLNFTAILGAYYSQIRDIVSDADKLEAIGSIGIKRCVEYTTHTNPSYTPQQVISDVKKHAHEKLLRLASQFIKTPTARTIANIRHKEMTEWLDHH